MGLAPKMKGAVRVRGGGGEEEKPPLSPSFCARPNFCTARSEKCFKPAERPMETLAPGVPLGGFNSQGYRIVKISVSYRPLFGGVENVKRFAKEVLCRFDFQ